MRMEPRGLCRRRDPGVLGRVHGVWDGVCRTRCRFHPAADLPVWNVGGSDRVEISRSGSISIFVSLHREVCEHENWCISHPGTSKVDRTMSNTSHAPSPSDLRRLDASLRGRRPGALRGRRGLRRHAFRGRRGLRAGHGWRLCARKQSSTNFRTSWRRGSCGVPLCDWKGVRVAHRLSRFSQFLPHGGTFSWSGGP